MKEGPFYKRREAIRLKNKSLLNNNCGYLLLLKWGRMVPFSFSHLFTFSQQKIGRARCLDCLHGISPQQAFNTHKLLLTHAIAHAIHISSIGTTIVSQYQKTFPLFSLITLCYITTSIRCVSPRLGLVRRNHSCPIVPQSLILLAATAGK